jgi:hypothetical protein
MMPMPLRARASAIAVCLLPLLLAACAGGGYADNPFAAAPPPPKPAVPAINMTGRWMLASPEGGVCAMTFSGKPGASEGAIAPEGGCPGQFFTSRHWALDQNGVSIINHKDETLAHLAASNPPGQFQGRAASGISVVLSR